MSKYNEFETREEAEKWAAGVIAGLLSFGALATRISEIETEDKKIDTPEIEAPDISVPSVNMNLGKNFGLSNIPADKLITIIFSLLMIIFIILSTIKGVRINRKKIVEDLLDGKFAFSFSVNGPTKFYLMGEVTETSGTYDYTLNSATSGSVKYIPGLIAPVIDESMQYLHAKNNGLNGSRLNAYFMPSSNDVSVISVGYWDLSEYNRHHVDKGDYDMQVGSFGEGATENVSVTYFEPEQMDDGSYGTFELVPKRWYSDMVNGAFFLRYYEAHPYILADRISNNNVSYMLPIKGVDIEYRPYQKATYISERVNLCIFKTITLISDYGTVQITNNLYPYGGEEGIVRFNEDYSSLYNDNLDIPPEDNNRIILFRGFYNKYDVTNNRNVPSSNITVKFNNFVMLDNQTHQNRPYAFNCGTGDDYVFQNFVSQGYSGDISKVHLGIVQFVSGSVEGKTSAYFEDVYYPHTVPYRGEGYSDINGYFVDTQSIENNRTNPTRTMPWELIADFSLGYTTLQFVNSSSYPYYPVKSVTLRGLLYENNEYTIRSAVTHFYDENGEEKIWSLWTVDPNTSAHFSVNIEPVYSIPTSSIRQDSVWYPFKTSSDFLRIDASGKNGVHSVLYNKDGVGTELSYKTMWLHNTQPKTTSAQQKTEDFIRSANVKGITDIDVQYKVETVDTNPHTDFIIATPCTVEVEVPDCYTDPPPQYSEGLDKARAELRCDEMYLIQIFGTDYMNLKTNDMSFAESYIPDCECGKTDRFFERY